MSKDQGGTSRIEKLFDVDFESSEWKEGVAEYNNRTIIKHDIESGNLLVVRRLLKEGNISVLDKENQSLLAEFIDLALKAVPESKKGRGRPSDDEINRIELMKFLSEEYDKLRLDEGLKLNETLERLSVLSIKRGKALGVKRIEELCAYYKKYHDYYKNRLYTLYYQDEHDLRGQYLVLIGDKEYIDHISSLDDCRPIEFEMPAGRFAETGGEISDVLRDGVDPIVHAQAIRILSAKYGLAESDVEKRIKWKESPWDHHDLQEFRYNPLFETLK